jgi:hypothetical protein
MQECDKARMAMEEPCRPSKCGLGFIAKVFLSPCLYLSIMETLRTLSYIALVIATFTATYFVSHL